MIKNLPIFIDFSLKFKQTETSKLYISERHLISDMPVKVPKKVETSSSGMLFPIFLFLISPSDDSSSEEEAVTKQVAAAKAKATKKAAKKAPPKKEESSSSDSSSEEEVSSKVFKVLTLVRPLHQRRRLLPKMAKLRKLLQSP